MLFAGVCQDSILKSTSSEEGVTVAAAAVDKRFSSRPVFFIYFFYVWLIDVTFIVGEMRVSRWCGGGGSSNVVECR